MPDVKVAVTRIAVNTVTGNQDITISGFGTPKAAIFILTAATADGSAAADARWSFGCTDGNQYWGYGSCSSDNISVTQTRRQAYDFFGIVGVMGTAADYAGGWNAWITDGVRISWSDAPSSGYLMTVILFGGADFQAKCHTFLTNSSVSVQTYSSMGFLATGMILGGSGALMAGSVTAGYAFTHGFATPTDQACATTFEDTSISDGFPVARTNNARGYQTLNNTGTVENTIQFSNWTTSGFDYQCSASVNQRVGFFAMKGCTVKVGVYNPPTTASPTASTLNPGFEPQLVILLMNGCAANNVAETDGDAGPVGMAVITPAQSYSNINAIQDNAATTNTESVTEDIPIYLKFHTGASVLYQASLTSMDPAGANFSFTTASATTRQWPYLAIEKQVLPGAPPIGTFFGYQNPRIRM